MQAQKERRWPGKNGEAKLQMKTKGRNKEEDAVELQSEEEERNGGQEQRRAGQH